MKHYMDVLHKYAVFHGRATRSEFWFFALFFVLIIIALEIVGGIIAAVSHSQAVMMTLNVVVGLYVLAMIVPAIAVAVRRLHDIGKSGWWYFIQLVPCVGSIWFIILLCTDSQPGENAYGPNPKGITAQAVVATA